MSCFDGTCATGAASNGGGGSKQPLTMFLWLLVAASSSASSIAWEPPISGVPFTENVPPLILPSPEEDASVVEMAVSRVGHGNVVAAAKHKEPPSACDMGKEGKADKKKCLDVERGCMWASLTTRDPLKRIQEVTAYCMPCELDGTAIPCWNPGAWVDGKQVMDCAMSCMHQERIWQPQYACSDDTGYISQMQCFDRAARSGSKCMFIEYEDTDGNNRASCAPCELDGTGGWGCPRVGGEGPVGGSKVKSCVSQCDVLCTGPPNCPPTVAPPLPPLIPPPQKSPGYADTGSPPDVMLTAPMPWLPVPQPNPMEIMAAARKAAEKAGWKIATPPPPPKVYWPVIYYRSPGDYMFTTGPPPLDGPEPPKPAYPQAPDVKVAMLQEFLTPFNVQRTPREPFLGKLRRRTFGH